MSSPQSLSFDNSLLNPLLAPKEEEFMDGLLDDGRSLVATR